MTENTLELSSDIVEEDIPAAEEVAKSLSLKDMLKVIANALKGEMINPDQARKLRMEVGVSQGYFTRKQVPKSKRVQRRKAQKEARKITYGMRR